MNYKYCKILYVFFVYFELVNLVLVDVEYVFSDLGVELYECSGVKFLVMFNGYMVNFYYV